MTTAQMQYFLVAAERLNFTAAAEQLYMTQPSLSRQIASVEAELGVRLFERANNIVRLTPAGEELYRRLSGVYDELQSVIKDVREVDAGTKGHLNIGILEDQYINDDLLDGIRGLLERNAGCELNIARHNARSIFAALTDGSVDAGLMLVYDNFEKYGFAYLPIDTSPPYLAVNRRVVHIEGPELSVDRVADLIEDVPLAMVGRGQFPEQLQDSLLQFAPFKGLRKTSRVQFLPDTGTVSLYVGAGLAVTLTNKGNLLRNDPHLALYPVKDIGTMTQGLVWRSGTKNPLVHQLVASMQQRIGTEPVE